jgi:hypothetical protein
VNGDLGDVGRHCENDVETGHWQQIGLTVVKPPFTRSAVASGSMPVTKAVEDDTLMRTVLAGFDMTAERGGPAKLDR